MNQREKLIIKYAEDLRIKFDQEPDMDLLTKVTIGCGPAIYNRDSSTVSSTEESEIQRVKTNFLIKKLGLSADADLDSPLVSILEQYGKTNRTKYRVVVYYLLVKHFKQEAHYN